MIEGGGLGAYALSEVGPVEIQEPNGVIDILVQDSRGHCCRKKYLSYFQGPVRSVGQRTTFREFFVISFQRIRRYIA